MHVNFAKDDNPLAVASPSPYFLLHFNRLIITFYIVCSYTFELIQEDSDKVWKFQRYDLVHEYHSRPLFSPPLILIGHFFVFIRWIWQLCRCGNPPKGSSMSKFLFPTRLSSWHQLALWCRYYRATEGELNLNDEIVYKIL